MGSMFFGLMIFIYLLLTGLSLVIKPDLAIVSVDQVIINMTLDVLFDQRTLRQFGEFPLIAFLHRQRVCQFFFQDALNNLHANTIG